MLLFLADLVLLTHVMFVAFVVLGLVVVLLGWYWQWRWIRNWWFRLSHLTAIGIVMAESWLGLMCPLTEWENRLRTAAGDTVYAGAFVQHWLHALLYYDFAPWVFTLAYTGFGLLVLLAWFAVPPVR